MHGGPSLRRLLLAFLVAAWVMPSWAASPDEATGVDETERWVPALGIIWGLFGQDSEASSASSTLSGSNPPEQVRPSTSGQQTLLNPFAGASFELMAPRMYDQALRPRVFAHVGVTASMGFSYDVAKEGDPGGLNPPVIPVPEEEVSGQGSVTEAQVGTAIVTSGAGIAFAVELGDWKFRIKPSVEYIREQIQVSGTLNRAVRLTPPPPAATTDFRFIGLGGQKTRSFHGIGPGLELEVDAARMGSFGVTLFLAAQAYALLGDRDIDFADSQTDASGTESAEWRFRSDEWLYRSTMGIRFRWLPKGDN